MSAGSSTLAKGLDLLHRMGDYQAGAPAAVFAKDTGMPFSTAYRLLNSLVASGFAEFDPDTKHYRPGLPIFELSVKIAAARGYDGTILPVLQQLSDTTKESCLFAAQDGLDSVTVHTVDGPEFRQTTDPGDRLPLHVSAMGKAILAGLAAEQAEQLIDQLDFQPRTEHTVTNAKDLHAQLAQARQQGYTYQCEEVDLGMHAIGAPVIGPNRQVLGSIAIAAPLFRATKEQLVAHHHALATATQQLAPMLATVQPRS